MLEDLIQSLMGATPPPPSSSAPSTLYYWAAVSAITTLIGFLLMYVPSAGERFVDQDVYASRGRRRNCIFDQSIVPAPAAPTQAVEQPTNTTSAPTQPAEPISTTSSPATLTPAAVVVRPKQGDVTLVVGDVSYAILLPSKLSGDWDTLAFATQMDSVTTMLPSLRAYPPLFNFIVFLLQSSKIQSFHPPTQESGVAAVYDERIAVQSSIASYCKKLRKALGCAPVAVETYTSMAMSITAFDRRFAAQIVDAKRNSGRDPIDLFFYGWALEVHRSKDEAPQFVSHLFRWSRDVSTNRGRLWLRSKHWKDTFTLSDTAKIAVF
jgi:hypothetical protein